MGVRRKVAGRNPFRGKRGAALERQFQRITREHGHLAALVWALELAGCRTQSRHGRLTARRIVEHDDATAGVRR